MPEEQNKSPKNEYDSISISLEKARQQALDIQKSLSTMKDEPKDIPSGTTSDTSAPPVDPAYVSDSVTTPVAKTEEEIQLEKTKAAQSQIDALNRYYDTLRQTRQEEGAVESRKTSAISTLTGLAGSTEAGIASKKTDAENQKRLEEVESQRGVAIAQILADIRSEAVEEAKQSRLETRQSIQDIEAKKTADRETAVERASALAMSGVTLEGLAKADPEAYARMAEQVGGTEMLKAMFTLNRPQETIIDKRVEGGKYIIAYQNPIDGKTRIETVDLGLPDGYNKSIDAGDRLLFIPDNWNGDTAELISINKGLAPSQPKDTTGVSNQGIDNERALMSQFRSEQIVKDYNMIVSQAGAMNNYIENGVGGPADLAFVFSFMKGLDPNSVVRESEYATASKSGNIFQGAFAKFNGYFKEKGGFLPENVREEFVNLVNQKLDSQQKLYDNVAKQYTDIAVRQGLNPQNVVVDYAGAVGGKNEQQEGSLTDEEAYQKYLEAIQSQGVGAFFGQSMNPNLKQ